MRCIWIILAGLLILAVNGGDKGFGAESENRLHSTEKKGFTSPDEAWKAHVKATKAEDWIALYDCLTPVAQDNAVFDALGGLIMSVEWHDLRKVDDKYVLALVGESDALLKSHGIDLIQLKKQTEEASHDQLDFQEICLKQLFDKRQFFAKSISLRNKIIKATTGMSCKGQEVTPKPKPDTETKAKPEADTPKNLGKLVKVKIRGDRATGKVTSRLSDSIIITKAGKRIRFVTNIKHFRRINGRWFLASPRGEPVKTPLHRITVTDVPYEKKFKMEAGDAFQFELPNSKVIAVWCDALEGIAEQTTSSGLKTVWGEKPFKDVPTKWVYLPDGNSSLEYVSYIEQGSVVTSGANATSTYQLFVGKWEFNIIEDLKAKDSLPVTIRVVQRKNN